MAWRELLEKGEQALNSSSDVDPGVWHPTMWGPIIMVMPINSCMVCNALLTDAVITRCELCEAVFHKSCTQIIKQQLINFENSIVITANFIFITIVSYTFFLFERCTQISRLRDNKVLLHCITLYRFSISKYL